MIDEKWPRAEEEAVSERSEEESLHDSNSLRDFVESSEEDMRTERNLLDTEEQSISNSVYDMDETQWLEKTNAEMLACEDSNDTTLVEQWSDLDSVDDEEQGGELDDSDNEGNDFHTPRSQQSRTDH